MGGRGVKSEVKSEVSCRGVERSVKCSINGGYGALRGDLWCWRGSAFFLLALGWECVFAGVFGFANLVYFVPTRPFGVPPGSAQSLPRV